MHTWYNQPSKERMLVLFSWPRDFSTWEEAGKKYRAEPSHLSPSQEGKERKMRLKFHYLLQGHILISRRPLSWPCHLKLSGPSCRAKSSHKRFGETFKIQTSAMIIRVAAIFWLFQECSRTSLGWPVSHEAFILFFNGKWIFLRSYWPLLNSTPLYTLPSVNLARVLRHLTYWGFTVRLLACVCGLSMFSVFIRSCEVSLNCPHLSCLSLFFSCCLLVMQNWVICFCFPF